MKPTNKLLFGKTLLIAFLGTVIITVLSVYLTGLTSHRSLLDNSIISLSILAVCFLLFLTFGLFYGLNISDNYSLQLRLQWKKALKKDGSWAVDLGTHVEAPEIGDGIAGFLLGIFLWIVVSIIIVWLLISLQAILWLTLTIIIAAIYWVLIRALKVIFQKSAACEGHLLKSITYATGYSLLYVGWIYGIVYASTLF